MSSGIRWMDLADRALSALEFVTESSGTAICCAASLPLPSSSCCCCFGPGERVSCLCIFEGRGGLKLSGVVGWNGWSQDG